MSEGNSGEIQRWTAKRRAALVVSIMKGEISAVEAARQHGPSAMLRLPGSRFVCLAYRVLGRTEITGPMPGSMMVPNGRFVAIHFCETPVCRETNRCSD